jgi:antibiotic biosynthesis monooxygenase (ABM) superfamily enzyme
MQRNHEPVTFNEWLVLHLLLLLPVYNIVLLIRTARNTEINPVLSNWAKAMLIVVGVSYLFSILTYVLLRGARYAM